MVDSPAPGGAEAASAPAGASASADGLQEGPLFAAWSPTGGEGGFGAWGFIDASGAWAIPPQFSDIAGKPGWTAGVSPVDDALYTEALGLTPGVFSGDLYAVCRTSSFYDGAPVWCYIDRAGGVVIDGLAEALNFTGALALARPFNDDGSPSENFTPIDRQGGFPAGRLAVGSRITCAAGGAADGSGALLFIEGEAGGSSGWGCIDAGGSWALQSAAAPEAPYVYASPLVFSEGLAVASGAPYPRDAYTFVDAAGQTAAQVVAPGGAGGRPLCREGRAFLDGRLYDAAGSLLCDEPRAFVSAYYPGLAGGAAGGGPFSGSRLFSDGVCPVQEGFTGLWGLVDQTGAYAVEPRYRDMLALGEGLAFAREVSTGLYGFIDASTGGWAVPPRFHSYTALAQSGALEPGGARDGDAAPSSLAHRFHGGLAFVSALGAWEGSGGTRVLRSGWVDRQGAWARSWAAGRGDGFRVQTS